MPDRPDKDQLVRSVGPSKGTTSTTRGAALPTREPKDRPLAEQRAALERQVEELEGVVRYMGAAHPQRQASQAKLERLKEMLKQVGLELQKKG